MLKKKLIKIKFKKREEESGPTSPFKEKREADALLPQVQLQPVASQKGSATGTMTGVTATVTDATQGSAIGDIFLRTNAKRQSPPGLAQLSVPKPAPFLPLQNYPLQVLSQTGFELFHYNHSQKSLDQIH